MSSTEKNANILVHQAVITTDPQKAVSEYFKSKAEDQRIKKFPNWDLARVGPAAELIRARRELSLAENELSTKQKQRIEKREEMDKEWANLRNKEITLRQSFQKFNKFAKENRDKRERAELKIKEELALQSKYEHEIREMRDKLEKLTAVKIKMHRYVDDYKMYRDFLERVISETGQFHTIADIFSRYESLVETRNSLAARQDQNLKALEDAGTEMIRLTDDKTQKLINLTNKLADLQSRYNQARSKSLQWETAVARIKSTTATKHLELTQVRSCCWNIYQQICKRKGIPVEVDRDDVENQLIHIKRTIVELKRIIRAARGKANKELYTKETADGSVISSFANRTRA